MPDLRKRRLRLVRRRPPRPIEPRAIQLAYLAELKKMLAYARSLVEARLMPLLRSDAADAVHLDAPRSINKKMEQISEAFYRAYPHERLEKLGERIAAATSEHQKRELFRQIKSTLGVELNTIADKGLRQTIQQFTAENVALIKSLPQTYFDDIEKRVLAGQRQGLRHTEIAEQLEERLGVAESRAKLIARDQVLKFNGELNKVRQQQLGLDRYIWRTVKDNRVRSEHEDRDGEIYSWDAPPGDESDPGDGGHPGEGINCRCYAEPVISDLLDE